MLLIRLSSSGSPVYLRVRMGPAHPEAVTEDFSDEFVLGHARTARYRKNPDTCRIYLVVVDDLYWTERHSPRNDRQVQNTVSRRYIMLTITFDRSKLVDSKPVERYASKFDFRRNSFRSQNTTLHFTEQHSMMAC